MVSNAKNNSIFIYVQYTLIILLFVSLFYKSLAEMIHIWLDNSNNSHGMIVPFVSLYLIWIKKKKFLEIELVGCQYGLLIILISLIVYLFGVVADIGLFRRLTIIGVIIGVVLFNGGKELFKEIAFPLLFLVFMIPIPDTLILMISFPLQLFATKVSHFFIQLMNIPAFREGNMIYFSTTQLEIAEACSGIRSIASYTMLSFLFAYLLKAVRNKMIIVLIGVPLAIMVNISRVTGTGILAHFFGGDVARGFLHEFSGIVVFVIGFIAMAFIFKFLSSKEQPRESQTL